VARGPDSIQLRAGTAPVTDLAWSPDGRRLASAGAGVTVWDPVAGRKVAGSPRTESPVEALDWSPEGGRLVTFGSGGEVTVWDCSDGRAVTSWHLPPGTRRVALAWALVGPRLVTENVSDGEVQLWDVLSQRVIRKLGPGDSKARGVSAAAWDPQRDTLAFACAADGTSRLWSMVDGRELVVPRRGTGWVRSMTWSPDGDRLAYGGEGIGIYEPRTGVGLLTLAGHNAVVTDVAWNPDPVADRRRLASVGEDGTLKVWDLMSEQEVLSLRSGKSPFRCVAWSPDGRHLTAGCADGTIKVWLANRARDDNP
jgi:WD40 repeat protein